MVPETHYARNGDISIAYQVNGDGPVDLVYVPRSFSHLDLDWESPGMEDFYERLGRFARVIRFDRRGFGLSDRGVSAATLEERMDDVRAVMDDVGSVRAALMGVSAGAPMSLLFAASHPDRVLALVLYGAYACGSSRPDHPEGRLVADGLDRMEEILDRNQWGDGWMLTTAAPPELAEIEEFREAAGRFERASCSPVEARDLIGHGRAVDVRAVLPAISARTLVVTRTSDRVTPPACGEYLARHIRGATVWEQSGEHLESTGDLAELADRIEEFVTGTAPSEPSGRVLATVLFTDIVSSTDEASRLGDKSWVDVLGRHDEIVRREVDAHRGRVVDSTGDGVLATFDGPARAVQCASTLTDRLPRVLGLEIRAGVHTGEIELRGARIAGIGVHIGARVAALAGPGEVLVSRTVKDLVVGSGLDFVDRGSHELKGVDDAWQLYALGN